MLRPAWLCGLALMVSAPGAAQELPAEAPGAPPGTYADPAAAAAALAAIVARDSLHFDASWRLAMALVDVAKQAPLRGRHPARDSAFRAAVALAERAVRLAPDRPEGPFALANALGRASLTRGPAERVRDARRIRDAARRVLALDPAHDGAWHVLGRWHAEIMRLSGVERFVARRFLGAGLFGEASWEEAIRHLERAVALRPDWIYHRLDLALVYLDRGRTAEARAQLTALLDLPARDVMDPVYRQEAAQRLEAIGRR